MTMLSLFDPAARDDKAANIVGAGKAIANAMAKNKPMDRKSVASVMTMMFGGDDANGAWSWKDAYEAIEVATVLHIKRHGVSLVRLEDDPLQAYTLLETLSRAALTHTRRSEEQVELDQFSTPAPIAALAALAGLVRPTDRVLEPSAGTGLLAVMAEICGAQLTLNELAETRRGILERVFPGAERFGLDGAHLHDLINTSGSFDVAITNPPFQHLADHLVSSLKCLADGGRLVAIVPQRALTDLTLTKALCAHGAIVGRVHLPANAFAKHGTSVDTALLIVDRGRDAPIAPIHDDDDVEAVITALQALPQRLTAKPRVFRTVSAPLAQRVRGPGVGGRRFALFESVAPVTYEVIDWTGEGRDVGVFQEYRVSRIKADGYPVHPANLVESSAMASIAPPAPSYQPVLPTATLALGYLSLEQMEAVIYAGEAHSRHLPGRFRPTDEQPWNLTADPEAKPYRAGFFIGDGTGVGKGSEGAAIIMDNFAQGRRKALWVSKNDVLIDDARRDWKALGGSETDIVPHSRFSQADKIGGEMILFTTYATLRQLGRNQAKSRLDQIVDWLGEDFDGVILFDEAHSMGNAAGGGDGARGPTKASQQGRMGLALQNLLPDARVVYESATGATTARNLAYATRLGLWGGTEAPFNSREDFLTAADAGGLALAEIVARDLKAAGLYLARSISLEGVVIEPQIHELTEADIKLWNAWADAFQMIHSHVEAALEVSGAQLCKNAKSAARSAFASTSQRFFLGLLSGIKAPSLHGKIRERLDMGMSVVIQLISTNEATLDRRLAETDPKTWHNVVVDLTPRDVVLQYLEKAFPVNAYTVETGPDGKDVSVPLRDADGNNVISQEALALRERTLMNLAMLPACNGILDSVIDTFGADAVAEVTGRSKRVVRKNGRMVVERRGSSANRAETDAFQSGRKKILVFSEAGGTGRSYHADLKSGSADRPRAHFTLEYGWRSDTAIQGLGRTHRTNQASAPTVLPYVTNLPGERRFLSTICRRLDSMGALTRGERRSNSGGMFRPSDNLETPFARRAQIALYKAMKRGDCAMSITEFERKTALMLRDEEGDLLDAEDLPELRRHLNRVLALRVEDQNVIFEAFDRIHEGILEKAAADGTLDKGMEDMTPSQLELVDEQVIRTDPRTGATTRMIHFKTIEPVERLSAREALAITPRSRRHDLRLLRNERSGNVGLAILGITLVGEGDAIIPGVRLITPQETSRMPLQQYQDSAWVEVDETQWITLWDDRVASLPSEEVCDLYLVTGEILPVWKHLEGHSVKVRRIKAPDGRRWLGRVLDEVGAHQLRTKLGLAVQGSVAPIDIRRCVMEQSMTVELAEGLFLVARRVMGQMRMEVDGASAQADVLRSLGVFFELISFQARGFVPIDRFNVLAALLQRFPVVNFHNQSMVA
ncbi:bifunctional class I SAM-dependent methyltransferase/DEAD/DEAH box helicase [Caulobacter sp. X]|uniref:bifunctional class I SAM-dependent methyltransferase/DEAD/DEAH box helicase n=1 Tax=Caulobacter sp. X TaxID=2048901 RepID=UPI000C15D64A|nr:bifunctional class I SAM-dependent methyltransferase/DEAD/DEAH box helicase [Caulobacter sp. X]PIB95299.1 methylase [Caulobacter sp. X]